MIKVSLRFRCVGVSRSVLKVFFGIVIRSDYEENLPRRFASLCSIEETLADSESKQRGILHENLDPDSRASCFKPEIFIPRVYSPIDIFIRWLHQYFGVILCRSARYIRIFLEVICFFFSIARSLSFFLRTVTIRLGE